MYAVVEFSNKKEFSIVPLIWLSDDKTWCYWPKNVLSEKQLKTLIESLSPAKETWTKYSIRRIHRTAGMFFFFFSFIFTSRFTYKQLNFIIIKFYS